MMEYFEGIMFLTTRRLKDFDLTMRSRVDFALSYPPSTCNQSYIHNLHSHKLENSLEHKQRRMASSEVNIRAVDTLRTRATRLRARYAIDALGCVLDAITRLT